MNESQVYGGHAKISVGENWESFYAKNNDIPIEVVQGIIKLKANG